MTSVPRFARRLTFALAGASVLAFSPALAKKDPPAAAPAAPGQRHYNLTKEERAALGPVQKALVAKDWAAATAALPAADAAAKSPDARYAIGQFRLQIGLGTNDEAMQSAAVDNLIASGAAEATELPVLYRNQAALALRATPPNRAKAEAAFARVVELTPNDSEALVNLAKVKGEARKPQEAVALLQRAIAAKKAAGQPVDESWYKYALKLAYDGKMAPESFAISRDLVAAFPTKENWRDTLLIYRDRANLDKAGGLDLLRLMRVSKALTGERDWFDLADTVNNAGYPGEAKAVLDEGVSLRMVDPKKAAFADLLRTSGARIAADRASLAADTGRAMSAPTGANALKIADAYYGYGDYAKAVELYRAAISKGGVDAGTAQLRLGMALAQAGHRAEAQTAFQTVTGPRAELASLWMTWLAQRS